MMKNEMYTIYITYLQIHKSYDKNYSTNIHSQRRELCLIIKKPKLHVSETVASMLALLYSDVYIAYTRIKKRAHTIAMLHSEKY